MYVFVTACGLSKCSKNKPKNTKIKEMILDSSAYFINLIMRGATLSIVSNFVPFLRKINHFFLMSLTSKKII